MWKQDKYLKITKSKRKGDLSFLELPKSANWKEDLYKLSIKPKSLELIKGKDTYLIVDEFGISENASFSYFFTDDFICIKLIKGSLYLKDGTDKIVSINHKNKIITGDFRTDEIIWKTLNEVMDLSLGRVTSKYKLTKEWEKKAYVNNLLFVVESNYDYENGKLFSFRFKELQENIGGSFKFEVKEEGVKPIVPIQSLEDHDYFYNTSEKKTKSNREKYVEDYLKEYEGYDLDDLDISDLEELKDFSSSMHEINIYNDFESIDEDV